MIKNQRIGFFCIAHVLGIAIAGVLSCAAYGETGAETVETDSTCESFSGARIKVADAKETRVDSHAFDGLQGKRIRKVEFTSMSVFDKDDPDENNSLYLFLNKLHINTRPGVVRAQLLFEEGEQLEISKIQESERILRARPYLTNAYIVPLTVCAEQIDVMVVTQDAWALEPQFSVGKESEGTESGFAIADGNIFGTGNSLTIGYEQTNERNLIMYEFSNPHIFNSQIATKLYYADTSDGRDMLVDISHPFYSLETPWAAGFSTQDETLEEPIRHMDEEINSFRHQAMYNEVYFGVATDIQSTHTQRWLVGVTNEEDNFFATSDTLQSIPTDRKAVYPWIEYQFLENSYGVFKNVNQIQRAEDIALGQNIRFRVGYAGTQFDNPDDVIRYIGTYSHVIDVDRQHIFESTFQIDGRYHSDVEGIDSSVAGISLSYNYFQDEKRRWYMGFLYEAGQDLAQYEELTVGDVTGLRGYPSDYQRGNERYVFTVERRYFTDIHLFNILRMGAVMFLDVGKAWGIDQYGDSPLLSDVGFGLRFSSSKVRIGNVVHVDIAVPTSERDALGVSEYQLTVGAAKKF